MSSLELREEVAKEVFLEELAKITPNKSEDLREVAKYAVLCADVLVEALYPTGPRQATPKLKGCKVCFGSGGKQGDPCKACAGTGKVKT